jgi:cyclophilin family peptidyl-prolyl cis-trans isomerase
MSQVKLTTNFGAITIQLDAEKAPKTVANFLAYVAAGHYDGTIFHRVIKDFMIQGGDPNGDGTGGTSIWGSYFPNETTAHKFVAGSLGMANAGKDTNDSQFFIVTNSAQPHLDGGYTLFGQVDASSMSVVTAIAALKTDGNDRPTNTADATITGFTIVQ